MLSKIGALAATFSTASAVYTGFNYGSTNTDGSPVTLEQFTNLFNTARNLAGTNGEFTAARLYTTVQAGAQGGVISAIPAAINTNTYLLLGLWASAGQANMDIEIATLNAAIAQYGTAFTSLIAGVSVGSEDLYRGGAIGVMNNAGVGAQPQELVNYINQVRGNLTARGVTAQITHVDTWNSWNNASNAAVVEAVDFVSTDAYPYFQYADANSITTANQTFYDALDQTIAYAMGKPVWITETGWPVQGPTENQAVASVANAKSYWDQVKCSAQGTYNLFWYTLQDSYPTAPATSFGIVGSTLSTTPLFDLTCPVKVVSSSSSSSSSSATSTSASPASVSSGSSASATSAPVSSASVSSAPVSSAPVSSASATSAPVSSAPVSSASATSAPVSSASISSVPVSSAPVSSAPVSSATASSAPASSIPPSSAPASPVPASSAPASSAPISSVPASSAPATTPAPASSPAAASSAVWVTATIDGQTVSWINNWNPAASTSAASSPAPVSSTPAPAPSASQCSTDILAGEFQYPHLIVPVDSTQPNTAFGTSYDGEFSSTVTTAFNFDIPASYAGRTCTVVFLLPNKANLETSDYTISGAGGLHFQELVTPATTGTTYNNLPAVGGVDVTIPSVTPGNSYAVASHECGAGQRISFKVSATGNLALNYFQDYNPSPIGAYISVC